MHKHSLAAIIATLAMVTPLTAYSQGSWLPYGTTGASDVAINPTGVVWLIGREPHSIRTTLVLGVTSFALPVSRANPARVAVDLNGFPWLVNSDGTVWHWVRNSAGAESWIQQPIKAIDIAVGASGAVWAIGTDKHVMRLDGDAWEPTSGTGVKIAVDPSGNPWVVNADGQISKYSGASWSTLPGTASAITIAPNGTVFILGPVRVHGGFEILRLNGSAWEPIVGGGATAIAAGSQAVYAAQDTSTNLVLMSTNTALRVDRGSPGSSTAVAASSVNSSNNGNAAGAATGVTSAVVAAPNGSPTTGAGSSGTVDAAHGSTGSTTTPAAAPQPGSSTAGKIGGLLGGLLSAGASAAAPIAGAVAEGAAAGAVKGAIPTTIGLPIPVSAPGAGGLLSAGSSAAASARSAGSPASAGSSAPGAHGASQPKLDLKNMGMRPLPQPPVPGNLICPIIGAGSRLAKSCSLVKQAAHLLSPAPPTGCAAPSFADPRNGGECWSCPMSFVRSGSSVDAKNACWKPVSDNLSQKVDTQYSVATQTNGCSLLKAVIGFGTAFRNGGECWACPLGLVRSMSTMNARAVRNFAECATGKNASQIIYQLAQYPESGVYRFMPGLLQMALADPKAVDAFLFERANGDSALKKKLWANMIADPAGSAELKALLFASLLTVAEKPDSGLAATDAVHEFETYVHDRRSYVANEAAHIYTRWQDVNAFAQAAKRSGGIGGIAAKVVGAGSNYGALAWSGAIPDSAGAAFIVASAALARLGSSRHSVDSLVKDRVSSFDLAYLNPVTKALENRLDLIHDNDSAMVERASTLSRLVESAKALKSAEAAMISTTLLNGAVGFRKDVSTLIDNGKSMADSSYAAEIGKAVSVKDMLESRKPEELQSLMLYWALATSPHRAGDVIGKGLMTGTELCSSNAWTTAECTTAKEMVAAAARAVGQ